MVARLERKTTAQEIIALFHHLDNLANARRELDGSDADLRAERTRIETVHTILRDKGPVLVRTLRKLETARAEVNPPADHWWWTLDRQVAEQRAQSKRRLLRRSAVGVAIVALLVAAYVLFLRPAEATRLKLEHTADAESAVEVGDYAGALDSYQQALQVTPDDPEINLMVGLMLEALDRPQEAEAQYAEAARLYGTTEDLLAARSQKYTRLGWYAKAEADAQEAIALDEQLAMGYLALGSAYEGQGRNYEAVQALETAGDLASAQEQNELYVIVKTRLSMLLQKSALPGDEVIEQPSG
jgi:tetratricopeptide (TPR) repeat protein